MMAPASSPDGHGLVPAVALSVATRPTSGDDASSVDSLSLDNNSASNDDSTSGDSPPTQTRSNSTSSASGRRKKKRAGSTSRTTARRRKSSGSTSVTSGSNLPKRDRDRMMVESVADAASTTSASASASASTSMPSSYGPTEEITATTRGEFRYLKPDEIKSGRLPAYDFAVIVNRHIATPSVLARWGRAVCCCGCCRSDKKEGRERGFSRLCMARTNGSKTSDDEQHRIVDQLCGQGLLVDIIDGGHSKGEMNSEYFILLLRAPEETIDAYLTHFRDDLWMVHGAVSDIEQNVVDRSAPSTPAERVQIVEYIITQRAGISPHDPWIHDMFPLHNKAVTDRLMSQWIASWQIFDMQEKKVIKSLRSQFGEKVAYYFAFINFYNHALIPLVVLGVAMEIVRSLVSTVVYMRILPFWGLGVSVVWSFWFLKSWDRRNATMQYDWNKRLHVKQIEYPNKRYYGDKKVNSLTGEMEVVYPSYRRIPKYICVLVFMLLQVAIMLVFVAIWVTIYEILKAKYREGRIFSTQWFLILLEGIVFGIFVDVIQWSMVVTKMGTLFTHWENYRTEEQYEKALIRKLFLLDFLNYYTWFFSLAFLFVIPGFGELVMNTLNHAFFGDAMNCCFGPYVDQHGKCIMCPIGDKDATCIECIGFFTFDRHHVDLSTMFVTPIVITQTLNILLQVIAPILVRKRRLRARAAADEAAQRRVEETGSMKILGSLDYNEKAAAGFTNKSHARYLEYTPKEIEVLNKKAREILFESEQDTYDPYNDFHALTVQYGFTVMFSLLWPLMPFACFLINLLKRRTDGYRLCKTLKRPIPRRANGIGSWRGIFTFYAYVAVIVNILLICLSTGILEFFDDTCVRDIKNQYEKQGLSLDDFIFGPDFGCLHLTWRLLIILVAEHLLIFAASYWMSWVPGVPKWIHDLMNARERRFKELLQTHEKLLFPGNTKETTEVKISTETTVTERSEEVTVSTTTRNAVMIDVEAITPQSEPSASDVEEPNSNGFRARGRSQLAMHWAETE